MHLDFPLDFPGYIKALSARLRRGTEISQSNSLNILAKIAGFPSYREFRTAIKNVSYRDLSSKKISKYYACLSMEKYLDKISDEYEISFLEAGARIHTLHQIVKFKVESGFLCLEYPPIDFIFFPSKNNSFHKHPDPHIFSFPGANNISYLDFHLNFDSRENIVQKEDDVSYLHLTECWNGEKYTETTIYNLINYIFEFNIPLLLRINENSISKGTYSNLLKENYIHETIIKPNLTGGLKEKFENEYNYLDISIHTSQNFNTSTISPFVSLIEKVQ